MNARTESHERLYLDDLRVGQQFTSGKYVMEEPRMKSFAAEFDPQPFHLDEAAANNSVFRGLAASGWYTAAASTRLMVDGELRIAGGLIGLGGEIAWPRPTAPATRPRRNDFDDFAVHVERNQIRES